MNTLEVLTHIAKDVQLTAFDRCLVREHNVVLPVLLNQLAVREEAWVDAATAVVSQLIYEVFYLRQALQPERYRLGEPRLLSVNSREDPGFGRLLREANMGSGWVSDGWRAVQMSANGHWLATDGALTLEASLGEIVGGAKVTGDRPTISLRFPNALPYVSAGFYTAVANAGAPRAAGCATLRVYFSVRAAGAPLLLRRLTSLVNRHDLRSLIKAINHPGGYGRPDSMVLFLEREGFLQLREELSRLIRDIDPFLEGQPPALAARWLRGVGIAEEPTQSSRAPLSFGEHRCCLIANGLARAFYNASTSDSGDEIKYRRIRETAILVEVQRAGLDPLRLYLNPGSEDIYACLGPST